jgi:hypothetical protein
MCKKLFCVIDLHSNSAMYVITDGRDKQLFRKSHGLATPRSYAAVHGNSAPTAIATVICHIHHVL